MIPPAPSPTVPGPVSASWRWRAWRLVRPVVRPVAWRLRTFFVGGLHDELAALRLEVAGLRAELVRHDGQASEALEPRIAAVMAQALLTLAAEHEHSSRPLGGGERELAPGR